MTRSFLVPNPLPAVLPGTTAPVAASAAPTAASTPPPVDPTLAEAAALTTAGARLRELCKLSPRHQGVVAANAAAPADLLRELARDASWLGSTLAANPAVPLDLLWELARFSPREVITNPLFQLALFVQPDIGAIPRWSLWSLFRTGLLPDDWYRWAYDHAEAQGLGGQWLLLDLAGLAHAPADVLRRLGQMKPFLHETLLRNPALPREVVRRLAASPRATVQVLVARSAHAPADWLERHARSPAAAVREAVAGSARTPARALARLASDASPEVRAAVAGNWLAPPGALRHIADVPVVNLLRNPSLPVERGRELIRQGHRSSLLTAGHGELLVEALTARDGQRRTRSGDRAKLAEGARPAAVLRAAQTATMTPEALARLAGSRRTAVRLAVAGNPATPAGALARLAADRAYEVRRAVARHATTPAAVWAWLADDPVAAVRRVARARVAAA